MTIVKKSHHMVTAKFSITAREQDILTLIFKELKRSADSIKYGTELELKTEFQFTTKDLVDYLGIGRDTAYELMATIAKGMVGKQAIVKAIAAKNENSKIKVLTLCSYGEYDGGQLTLRIDKTTAHYMLDYGKGFAEIDFKLSLSLKGVHEKRLLDLISRFKYDQYTCFLGEFYALLGVNPKHYSSFTVFRRTVLDKPLKRLIDKSNGAWIATDEKGLGYELSKIGRSYTNRSRLTLTMKFVDCLKQ